MVDQQKYLILLRNLYDEGGSTRDIALKLKETSHYKEKNKQISHMTVQRYISNQSWGYPYKQPQTFFLSNKNIEIGGRFAAIYRKRDLSLGQVMKRSVITFFSRTKRIFILIIRIMSKITDFEQTILQPFLKYSI